MAKAPAPDAAMASQIGLWLAVLLGFQVLGRLGARLIGLDAQGQAGVAMASSNGNTAFLGTAVLVSLQGPSILPLVAAFVAVENIVLVGLGVAGLKMSLSSGQTLISMARTFFGGMFNPASVGALIGFLISVSGSDLPPFLARPLEMLGSAGTPAGLVALGIVMATTKASIAHEWQGTLLVVLLKCAALPIAMFAAFSMVGAPTPVIIAATVLAACPSAVNLFIQARQINVWAPQAATAVFATTLVSIISVSLAASLAL